jgi:hypothetical protein
MATLLRSTTVAGRPPWCRPGQQSKIQSLPPLLVSYYPGSTNPSRILARGSIRLLFNYTNDVSIKRHWMGNIGDDDADVYERFDFCIFCAF